MALGGFSRTGSRAPHGGAAFPQAERELTVKEIETVRRRLSEQRLGDDRFDQPVDAVRWLGAVQAQEFAEAKWSLAERTRRCTDTDVEASFTRGEIIRTHLLRPTWHFVAREDVRWFGSPGPASTLSTATGTAGSSSTPRCSLEPHHVIAEALRDGETKTRKQLATKRSAVVHATVFGELTGAQCDALHEAGTRFGRFLGVEASVHRCRSVGPRKRGPKEDRQEVG